MEEKSKKRILPLHIHISTLFVVTVLVICSTLIYLTNSSLYRVLMSANTQLFTQIASETKNTLNRHYAPAFTAVSIFANGYVNIENRENEDNIVRSQAAFLLKEYPHITSFSVSYPDGRVKTLVTLDNPSVRHFFEKGDQAKYAFLVGDITTNNLTINLLDDSLAVLNQSHGNLSEYRGLEQSWRSQALVNETQISEPHMYPKIKKIGIAFYSRGKSGVVVSAHVLLSSLSESLSETSTQASAIRVLFSSDQQLYAYNRLNEINKGDLQHNSKILLKDLNNSVIDHAVRTHELTGGLDEFEFEGEHWFGKVESVVDYHGTQLYLLMADKSEEMLQDAYDIRTTTIFASVIILLFSIPIIYQLSQRLARPITLESKRAQAIERFDFSTSYLGGSSIKEIHDLKNSLQGMQGTINRYINLTNKIAHESDLDELLKLVALDTLEAANADGVTILLLNREQTHIEPRYIWFNQMSDLERESLYQIRIPTHDSNTVLDGLLKEDEYRITLIRDLKYGKQVLQLGINPDNDGMVFLPLRDRNGETIGIFGLLYRDIEVDVIKERYIDYIMSLLDYVAVSIDARTMLQAQKDLLEAIIHVIANSLDTKSPYTGNHCQRVPILTEWLSYAAAESDDPAFRSFTLSETEKEALHIAAWLHDCGKVTTPEHVVDKATKLETIYNRIHEIRTRFEVLKRDAELAYYKQQFGELSDINQQHLAQDFTQIEKDFAFIAQLNQGSEALTDAQRTRLETIAEKQWLRTLDKTLGLSWEERNRLTDEDKHPAQEYVLEDKPEQRIERSELNEREARFNIETPQLKNNLGERYNLLVGRGTLNNEERFVINDHIVQTITMLEALPFPRGMNQIPEIAGGHHEKMNGEGYPLGLTKEQMPLTARVMAIADIFEALTSSDRPYKKAKTLCEAIKIMSFMVKDQHIDNELFALFLTQGLHIKYAQQFLQPEQIDDVDINEYL